MASYTSTQPIPRTGLQPTYNAVAASDRIPVDCIVHVKNGNASSITVTFATLDTADSSLVVADVTSTTIATGGAAFFWIPRVWPYIDATVVDGLVQMTCSLTPSVTFALITNP